MGDCSWLIDKRIGQIPLIFAISALQFDDISYLCKEIAEINVESFFRTHKYLVEHLNSPVRRLLMDEIDWSARLIGIKGTRGVGKTTFLLSVAQEFYGADNRECLYINLNQFFFTERTIVDFADEFRTKGGKVLLLDQVFKYPNWSKELRYCYFNFPDLKIVFTGSSIMRLKEENPDLFDIAKAYYLPGFSFREFLNISTGSSIPPYTFDEIRENHHSIIDEISTSCKCNPKNYFQDYIHHGFYPFFLEKRNFSENLLKTMNMILEVDVLYIKQIEQSYLPKLRKLLYLLSQSSPYTPNVSQLSKNIETSRATVMNYIIYLKDARLINALYPQGEALDRKPSKIYMYNTNLMYAMQQGSIDLQGAYETFFFNQMMRSNTLSDYNKNAHFRVNDTYDFRVEDNIHFRNNPDIYYAVSKIDKGEENILPLWLFGFQY